MNRIINKLHSYSSSKLDFYFSHTNYSTLLVLSKIYILFFLNDRFNLLNNEAEWNILCDNMSLDTIYSQQYLTFEECCQKRVEEIIDKANKENKKIYVSLSGGVDSTCVTCSFLMNDKLDKSNFFVLYNHFTVEEYPLFIDLLKKNNINLVYCNDFSDYNILPKDNIVINGMCGDQLDGSNLTTKKYTNINYFSNWKDAFCIILKEKNLYNNNVDNHISNIENYFKYFNLNKNNFGAFSWLINFGCKWSFVTDYLCSIFDDTENKIPFFNTLYFQKYCLSNLDKILSRTQVNNYSYKTEWKKIIFKYTKDMDYFIHKGKDDKYFKYRYINNNLTIVDNYGIKKYNTNYKNILKKYIKDEYKDFFVEKEI